MSHSASDPDRVERAAQFWNDRHKDPVAWAHDNFLNHPMVQAYVSLRALGSLVGHLDVVIAELRRRTRPGDRVVSFGCGPALKERVLAKALPDREFVGIDIAAEIVERAREECVAEGITNLLLEQGDFNRLQLPTDSFKVVLGLGAIHHVEELEGFWDSCRRALGSDGAVLAQEFIGPNRFQWTENQIEAGNRALRELVPEEHRVHHGEVVPTPIETMLELDPSEAVRSAEILATCKAAGFQIEGYAGAGCALLQPVLMYQISTFDPRDWSHNRVLADLFEREDQLMAEGVLGDDFAMFVAKPGR